MARKRRRKAASRRRKRRVSGDPSLAPAVVSGTRRRRKHSVYGKVRKHRRRVKGMGAITGSNTGDLLLGAALGFGGGLLADMAVKKIEKAPAWTGKALGAVKILGGGMMAIKGKSPLAKGVGVGVALQGAYQEAHEFGIIKGMDEFMSGIGAGEKDTMLIEMNGVDINSTRFISGSNTEQPPVIGNSDDGVMSGSMPSIVS